MNLKSLSVYRSQLMGVGGYAFCLVSSFTHSYY